MHLTSALSRSLLSAFSPYLLSSLSLLIECLIAWFFSPPFFSPTLFSLSSVHQLIISSSSAHQTFHVQSSVFVFFSLSSLSRHFIHSFRSLQSIMWPRSQSGGSGVSLSLRPPFFCSCVAVLPAPDRLFSHTHTHYINTPPKQLNKKQTTTKTKT